MSKFHRLAMFLPLVALMPPYLFAQTVTPSQPAGAEIDTLATRQAQTWNLTIDEWKRSTDLRTLHHGLLSASLTPLEVLGILAETPEDRQRYARLFAARQLQILEQIAEFEADYLEAVAALADDRRTRMHLVAEVACLIGPCTEPITEALDQAKQGRGVDIFVLDAASDGAIRVWAAHHLIPPDLVRSRMITLNHARPGMAPGLSKP